MVLCPAGQSSDAFRLLRAHGWARNARYVSAPEVEGVDPRYMFLDWGLNVRPTELQAAFGLVQLDRLPGFSDLRESNAKQLVAFIDETPGLETMQIHPSADCSWFAFPVMVDRQAPFTRDQLTAHLEEAGVETRPVVAGSIARQPAAARFPDLRRDPLPGADEIHERGFYIGIHPIDASKEISRLAEVVSDFLESSS